MELFGTLLIIAAAILLIILVFKLIRLPLKFIFKLLIHMAAGFLMLMVVNFLGSFVHISLTVNWLTSLISGILGVPGVILLLVLKYIL